jgi:hypothetical protein
MSLISRVCDFPQICVDWNLGFRFVAWFRTIRETIWDLDTCG